MISLRRRAATRQPSLRYRRQTRLKKLPNFRVAAALGMAWLVLLASCGPANETPRRDEPRRDEARADQPRPDETHGTEPSRRESKSERRREKRRNREESAYVPSASAGGAPTAAGQPHDLAIDEAQGGHTLSRHVGRSDADLRERLERERNISAASTYTNRATAEAVVGSVLDHNAKITQWEGRGDRRPNLALDYHGDASRPIGRCMQRGSPVAVPASDAIVVLKAKADGGFYVLTTYPECPR
jgi:hypothetical protein